MWSEQAKYKNHFLQIQLQHLKPKQINEMVDKEILKCRLHRCGYGQEKQFTKVGGITCKSALYFEDRAELAYGFGTLPKLMRQLGSDDYLTQWKAINSLAEYIENPLYAQRAITQYDIVRRCQNVFLRIRLKYRKVKYREIYRLLHIFYYIAMHRNGAKKILEKHRLLDQFYAIIKERNKHLEALSKILPFLSQDIENCLVLIDDYKVYDKLCDIWQRDPCISYYPADLWLHLSHVIEQTPQEAIQRGFFDIFYQRIKGQLFQYHLWDMKCFALLLRCPQGQQLFLQVDGVKLLYGILSDQQQSLDCYENIVFALMNGLFAKAVLWRCREFTDLPLILTNLAKDHEKLKQQLFCLQTLRELGVMPVIKRFIKANCLEDIKNLNCKSSINEQQRLEIVYWLEREIFHSSNLRMESLAINEM
ncbi:uncharacterized protein LOC119606513 [Lucilia sericata]|uniref:uncharacterized protein LOC119606513 n=1 Tax=Lucilia sericata TaxID=13632 RepID=UPI0018A85D50|nr:uncharacterized protein LOC119606513 [Lucilia sericata]